MVHFSIWRASILIFRFHSCSFWHVPSARMWSLAGGDWSTPIPEILGSAPLCQKRKQIMPIAPCDTPRKNLRSRFTTKFYHWITGKIFGRQLGQRGGLGMRRGREGDWKNNALSSGKESKARSVASRQDWLVVNPLGRPDCLCFCKSLPQSRVRISGL